MCAVSAQHEGAHTLSTVRVTVAMMIDSIVINKMKWPIDIGYQEQISNHPAVLPDNAGGIEWTGSKGGQEPLR
ncbi:MAG: hypothetical protein A2X05_03715 [Bacteroidetes bacterium GWE2_41_25]|nr:MAG: hypothetical protein A2X05_03715 [Bacteroidetes bacterium GWE2_41_25]